MQSLLYLSENDHNKNHHYQTHTNSRRHTYTHTICLVFGQINQVSLPTSVRLASVFVTEGGLDIYVHIYFEQIELQAKLLNYS